MCIKHVCRIQVHVTKSSAVGCRTCAATDAKRSIRRIACQSSSYQRACVRLFQNTNNCSKLCPREVALGAKARRKHKARGHRAQRHRQPLSARAQGQGKRPPSAEAPATVIQTRLLRVLLCVHPEDWARNRRPPTYNEYVTRNEVTIAVIHMTTLDDLK